MWTPGLWCENAGVCCRLGGGRTFGRKRNRIIAHFCVDLCVQLTCETDSKQSNFLSSGRSMLKRKILCGRDIENKSNQHPEAP